MAVLAIAIGLQRLFLGGAGALAAPAKGGKALQIREPCGEPLVSRDEVGNMNVWVIGG
jgi:hypothetical protein